MHSFPLKCGSCLPYPLPPEEPVTLWRWEKVRHIRDFVKQILVSVPDPHWRWCGRTIAQVALASVNDLNQVIMPDEFRTFTQPITVEEKAVLEEIFKMKFEDSIEASLIVARKIEFAIVPTTGLVWYERQEQELVRREARLQSHGKMYQWTAVTCSYAESKITA